MFARLLAFAFITIMLIGPLAALASFAGYRQTSSAAMQQKSMCLTTGIGCGSGHILLPAIGRM